MSITITDNTKFLLARYGPNKLFGNNVDERKQLDEQEAVDLFDDVWDRKLKHLITNASSCNSREAYLRLTKNQQNYFNHDQQHRNFREKTLNAEFIAQLADQGDGNYELTQFWRILSSDTHPKTLFVTFETVHAREQFQQIAQHLGIVDEKLGLQLCQDFIKKFPSEYYS